uniref:C2H2-type domain-containing protein n=1 Tax=Arion vulgaris TaxID=1028688 RepID=A0A0B7BTE1_9EUPU
MQQQTEGSKPKKQSILHPIIANIPCPHCPRNFQAFIALNCYLHIHKLTRPQ